jgi:hypothetical protein
MTYMLNPRPTFIVVTNYLETLRPCNYKILHFSSAVKKAAASFTANTDICVCSSHVSKQWLSTVLRNSTFVVQEWHGWYVPQLPLLLLRIVVTRRYTRVLKRRKDNAVFGHRSHERMCSLISQAKTVHRTVLRNVCSSFGKLPRADKVVAGWPINLCSCRVFIAVKIIYGENHFY